MTPSSALPTLEVVRGAWRPERFKGVVFDVGMHDGTDTAFYLHQGCAVVAVEADPTLAARGATRFASAIDAGQLVILNIGITTRAGSATFWICDDNSVWNSFDESIASRAGSRHHPIDVATWRFGDVLAAFGTPDYVKIDIEGHDAVCIADLEPDRLPRFISVESECVGDGVTLTDAQATEMLTRLHDAGYARFQLVSQDDFRSVVHPDRWRGARRLLDSMAYGKLRALGLARVAERFTHRGRMFARNRYEFACGGTGPWGDGLLGRWVDYDKARRMYLELRREYFRDGLAKTYSFWYDWHATY